MTIFDSLASTLVSTSKDSLPLMELPSASAMLKRPLTAGGFCSSWLAVAIYLFSGATWHPRLPCYSISS